MGHKFFDYTSNKLNDLDKRIPIVTNVSFWLERQRPKNIILLYPILKMKDSLRNFIFRHRKKKYFAQVMPTQKAIYFYIYKVANSSLRSAFNKYSNKDIKIDETNISQYTNFYKFAFVRNPYSRLYSAYCNSISSPTNESKKLFLGGIRREYIRFGKKFYPKMSFEEFINAVCSIDDQIADEHFLSQYKFITDKKGNLIVDEIFKLENIKKDFPKVCKKLNIKQKTLPTKNKTSKREPYYKVYTKQMRDKVYQRYKKDFILFKYDKEMKNEK